MKLLSVESVLFVKFTKLNVTTVIYKRFFNPPSGVIRPFSYHSLHRLDTRFLFSWKGRHIGHFVGHISGPGSRRHIYFKLNL